MGFPSLVAVFALAGATIDAHPLEVLPATIRLDGPEAMVQLVVTGRRDDGRPFDLTRQARYAIADAGVARVDSEGLVRSESDGRTALTVEASGRSATVPVVVVGTRTPGRVGFAGEVVPILTRSGCNAGGCHGKSTGQNGFRLSLLGFEPRADFEAIVREGRGRRVFPAEPSLSLLLRKPTARTPHGGGERFSVGSPEYRTIARWIEQGARFDAKGGAAVVAVEVEPARRVVPRRGRQQLRVIARRSDGTESDVTRLAAFESNATDVATVGASGLVEAGGGVGEAAITTRFAGLVAVARATVPLSEAPQGWAAPASSNPIDPLVFGRLRALGIEPSGTCTDAEFARRSSLDLGGVLPDPAEVAAFEASRDPEKRAAWVDARLARPEYADLFAMTWSAILKNRRTLGPPSQPGSFAFHAWIRGAIAENMPYDRFVAAIVAARGEIAASPPVVWYRQVDTLEARADDAAQLFLGLRIGCARCHHHPSERWSQDDYYSFASFFARVSNASDDPTEPNIQILSSGLATNPVTGRPRPPRPLGGTEITNLGPTDDPRTALVDWFRRPDNPYFARALVNRYWKHFLGRGLVEPEDDFRVSNPPSNPALLDLLADSFVRSGYDTKALVRLIATSRAYDRSSLPNATNGGDRRNFARFPVRRLPAEVLLDAIGRVTGSPTRFVDLPASARAVQLPDDGFDSEFLAVFGRPRRETACECERSSEPNLAQTLHLLNAPDLQAAIAASEGRARRWAGDPGPDAAKVDELYRIALGRPASADERAACLSHLETARHRGATRQGFEDLVWAILNTKEFLFNH